MADGTGKGLEKGDGEKRVGAVRLNFMYESFKRVWENMTADRVRDFVVSKMSRT